MDTEHTEHREIARLIGDLRRVALTLDDLAATLATRTAEHAHAMARVRELEAAARHALPWVGHLPTEPDATAQMLAARRRLMVAIQGGDTAEVSRAE